MYDDSKNEQVTIQVVEKRLDWFENSTKDLPLPPFLAYSKSGFVQVNLTVAFMFETLGLDLDEWHLNLYSFVVNNSLEFAKSLNAKCQSKVPVTLIFLNSSFPETELNTDLSL